MKASYYFTFEEDWRRAPVAFWVHVPVPGTEKDCSPPAPEAIPHKGYLFLHIEFESYELQFSSPAQLDHFIEVLASKPLPTSHQLSLRRGLPVGPNSHWLSRLPAALKAPRKREKLVQELRSIMRETAGQGANNAFQPMPSARLN
ncbi:hypothetical protein [Pseudoduganella violaceinigra]|uniref:hypothetical protein n=1 Tax=Pseudoduganella violaceinigra TaxID=246602 RepID=UPI0012B558BD|nr:hypothetical protein [Pseudoduganella violaceinigra]